MSGIGKEIKLDNDSARRLVEIMKNPKKPYKSDKKISSGRVTKEMISKIK